MASTLYRPTVVIALIVSSVLCAASTHVLTPSPTTINFGTQTPNTTTTQGLVVTNSGTGSVQVQAVTVSGSTAFQVSGFTGAMTLRPSQSLQLTISFTPPAPGSYAGTLGVTATGGAGISVPLSGSASGTTSVSVTVSPAAATVQVGATQQFTATVTGTTNTSVTWMVNGVVGGNSTLGTITAGGLYTAPANVPSGGSVNVSAQSAADPTKSGNATVTITTAQTTYTNIDDSTTLDSGGGTYGWGWCGTPTCAGGSTTATQNIAWGQQPSLDGGSTQFMITGSNWADGLWWYKLGPNDNVANFQFDFWLNVSQPTPTYAQALEFDTFQFVNPTRYMFGTQCDYAHGYNSGTWDVWNQGGGTWYHTSLPCPSFVPGDWYHITWTFNRTSDQYEHYNTVVVQHYDSTGVTQLDSSSTPVNIALPSGPLPSGWNDNMGVQFQLDINGVPGATGTATYSTFVDEAKLTVW